MSVADFEEIIRFHDISIAEPPHHHPTQPQSHPTYPTPIQIGAVQMLNLELRSFGNFTLMHT